MAAQKDIFVLVKPDGVRRNLVSVVIGRFEAAGFRLEAARRIPAYPGLAAELYPEHVEKAFFPELAAFMASGDTFVVLLSDPYSVSHEHSIRLAREKLGATDPAAAATGTIRADLAEPGRPIRENVAHVSDTPEATARDIERWFSDKRS